MKAKCKLILVPFLSLVLPFGLQAADVLEPAATIALPTVKGRIDHFGVDLKQQRLFGRYPARRTSGILPAGDARDADLRQRAPGAPRRGGGSRKTRGCRNLGRSRRRIQLSDGAR